MSHTNQSQDKTKNPQDEHRIIPGGVVPTGQSTLFDSIKSGFGWGIGTSIARNLFGAKKEPTEFERCLAEHREDLAYCAQFAEKK